MAGAVGLAAARFDFAATLVFTALALLLWQRSPWLAQPHCAGNLEVIRKLC
jgi:hypothetical protein